MSLVDLAALAGLALAGVCIFVVHPLAGVALATAVLVVANYWR